MTTPAFNQIYASVPADQKQMLADFRTSHPYKEMDIDGATWRYISCGQGDKALLFLPGGFLTADMWFHSILALENDYRIIAPDAFALVGVFNMDDVCSALVQILADEGIEQVTAIGLSAGGGVAQYMLQEYPERLAHSVFSHCGVLESNPDAEKTLKRLTTLVKLLPLWVTRRILIKRTSGDIPPSSRWIEFHNAYFKEAGTRISKEILLGFFSSSASLRQTLVFKADVVAAWPGQILLLASRDDEMAISSLEKLRSRFPQSETHLFEEGGHHTFMLYPEAYTNALVGFLDKVHAR